MSDRAAQFSPFAALTGYDAAVKEAARLTDRRISWMTMKKRFWMPDCPCFRKISACPRKQPLPTSGPIHKNPEASIFL